MKKIFCILACVLIPFVIIACLPKEQKAPALRIVVRNDEKSIEAGKKIFMEKCKPCHDAYSTRIKIGPGLIGILKNPELPVSKKPATPENIVKQLKNPYRNMPAFGDLPDEEVLDIIAFLNTL